MAGSFCPIIRESCKKHECIAWKEGECLIFSFLDEVANSRVHRDSEEELISAPERLTSLTSPSEDVPKRIRDATPEELATDLVAFAKQEFAEGDKIWISQLAGLFWAREGVQKWSAPTDIQLKMQKAERMAQQQLDRERDARLREQLEKEKAELPSLVTRCLEWAKKQGLKRLAQADVDAFLFEEGIEIQPQIKRALYAKANIQIKSST